MTIKTAFVTGAGSGIGREISMVLASKGMNVIATDINKQAAEETIALMKEASGNGVAVYCDVASHESVQQAVKESLSYYESIDVLVNNAGWDKAGPFLENDPAVWRKLIDINLMGHIYTSKEILPIMIKQGKGKVVNIASDAGRVGSSGEAVYSAAKGGVISFTKTMAREMARYKINVNCVCPGPADTPLFAEITAGNERLSEALKKAIPFRRLAEPKDIANAVAYFASDEADYVTGQTLSVSGGLTMS